MHKSSSVEQQNAQMTLFKLLCDDLKLNPKDFVMGENLPIISDSQIIIRPDFYSEKHRIIGEIHAHIGKLKPAQSHKICADILKMLLFENVHKTQLRKMIVVGSYEEFKQLSGKSYVAEAIRQFDIELVYVRIDSKMRDELIQAQKRQRMINA